MRGGLCVRLPTEAMNRDGTNRTEGLAPDPRVPRDDSLAAGLRGFGPPGVIALLAILLTGNIFVGPMIALPVGATLVLAWARWSRTPWLQLGLARPVHWGRTLAGGVLFGVTLAFVLKAIVKPLLGIDPVNHAYHFLAGNRAMLPAAVWAMFVAGFGEELVFRGYLFERLGRLLGPGTPAKVAIVLITSAWFGAEHYLNQGLAGVAQATLLGLIFGTIAMRTGRIWLQMIAHTAFDLTALAFIYWDVETEVAHLFLK
jgi:membrane protease YdiL (CAAX protease family)